MQLWRLGVVTHDLYDIILAPYIEDRRRSRGAREVNQASNLDTREPSR